MPLREQKQDPLSCGGDTEGRWVTACRRFEGHLTPLPVHVQFHCPAWLVALGLGVALVPSDLCTPDEVSLDGDLGNACLQVGGRHGSVARVSRVNTLEPQVRPSIAAQQAWLGDQSGPEMLGVTLTFRDLAAVLSYTPSSEVCRWCVTQGAYTYIYRRTYVSVLYNIFIPKYI